MIILDKPVSRIQLMHIEEHTYFEELRDYFMGENIYQTTETMLTRYYDAFLYRENE